MRLFFYYAGHTLKNQIKKLMKTYVAIFLVIIIIGGIFGFAAAMLSDTGDNSAENPDEYTEELPYEDAEDEEDYESIADDGTALAVLELISGVVILVFLGWSVISADKNGSGIFLMGDVNLLFQAPMKPQSVLMFRLIFQMGAALAASIYLGFQIPNLCLNVGLSLTAALSLIVAWVFTLIFGRLLSVLIYTVTATHLSLRKYITPAFVGICAIAAAAFVGYWKSGSDNVFDSAVSFFNSDRAVFVPVWGWIRGIVSFSVHGNTGMSLVMVGVCIVGCAALVAVIWNIKADFYEDAMAKSEETAALMEAKQSQGKSFMKRKKDRSERLLRNAPIGGSGASVLFFRDMYNRKRFSRFGILTSTGTTYLLIALAATLIARYSGHDTAYPAVILLAATAYFRSFGNPLSKDVSNVTFLMMPTGLYEKFFWPALSETVNSLLDLLPAIIVTCVLVPGDITVVLAGAAMALTLDVASSCAGALADLSLPESISKGVKVMIQVMFVYIGMIPVALIMIFGFATGHPLVAMLGASAFNLVIGGAAFAITPNFIRNGRK